MSVRCMLSNTKHMPLSHAITHAKGGSDEITPASIGAKEATWVPTPNEIGSIALAEGVWIDEKTDLNTITTYGNYRCTMPDTVKTLFNCPTTLAFKMEMGSCAPGVKNY